MRSSRFALLLLGALLALALTAVPAFADEYDVSVCTSSVSEPQITAMQNSGADSPGFAFCGSSPDGGIFLGAGALSVNNLPLRGSASWEIQAAPDTRIRSLFTERLFVAWNESLKWSILISDGHSQHLVDVVASGSPALKSGPIEIPVEGQLIEGSLECDKALTGCVGTPGTSSVVSLHEAILHMIDLSAPEIVELEGSLLEQGPLSGTVTLVVKSEDRGAGVAAENLFVEGQEVASHAESNGGLCMPPYRSLTPCPSDPSPSLTLDTTKLSNGIHEFLVEAVDASGAHSKPVSHTFAVENKPPVETPDDNNPPPPPPPPPPPDTTAPTLSALTLSPRSLHLGGKAKRKRRAPVLRFTSSETAQLSIEIEQLRPGHKPRPVGAPLARSVATGPGSLPIPTRIAGRPLRPGHYRLTIVAGDAAGNLSLPAQRPFTVLHG